MQWVKQTNHIIQDLVRIRDHGWNAVIAGGALRDAFHEKPFTDVDIFINKSDVRTNNGRYNSTDWKLYWLKVFDCDRDDKIRFVGKNYGPDSLGGINRHLHAVWNVIKGQVNYQIIFIDIDPVDYVMDYFDFGICKAYCDGTKVRFTDQFIQDFMDKTITLYPGNLTSKQIKYAKGPHLEKIKAKYPGYTPVLPNTKFDTSKKT